MRTLTHPVVLATVGGLVITVLGVLAIHLLVAI
jgi:hypothetical protein